MPLANFFTYLTYIALIISPIILVIASPTFKTFKDTAPKKFIALYLIILFESGAYEWVTSWIQIGGWNVKESTTQAIENNPELKDSIESAGKAMNPERKGILDSFKDELRGN